MKILNNFTLKNIKLNKKRSIVTIVGIVLSVALICAVTGMFSSFSKTVSNAIVKSEGDYHVAILDVDKEDLKYYKYNHDVKKYYIEKAIGVTEERIPIVAYDQNELDTLNIEKGRLPKNNNEIIVSSDSPYKLNDTITINAYVVPDNYEEFLNQEVEIDEEELGEELNVDSTEQLKKSLNYKVVGLYDSNYGMGSLITKLDDMDQALSIKLVYKNIRKTYKITNKIKKNYTVQYNKDLLMWSGVSSNNDTKTTLYMIVGIVLGIIVVTSVFVIRNSFEISITEKMRQFGMLSSIGATKKQIRKSVLFEGFILGLIGIPLGILLGYSVIHILILFTNTMFKDMISGTDKFVVDIPLFAIMLSVVLGGLTILLSSLKSAIKASKVSPIVAIRANNDIKIKKKKLKTPKLISKLFGVGGVISYKNLKRNKKKYRTTVISLVVSISIFIALSFFTNSLFKVSGVFYKESYHNVLIVQHTDAYDNETKLNNFNKIIKLDNIDNYSINIYKNLVLKPGYETEDRYKDTSISLNAIGDKEYKEYLNKLHLNYNDVKDKIIYIENTTEKDPSTKKIVKAYNFKAKDTLTFYNDENKEYKIEVAKVTKNNSMDLYLLGDNRGVLLVSNELLNKIDNTLYIDSLKIKTDNPDKLERDIEKLNIEKLDIQNYSRIAREMNKIVLWISVFLYGFIIVITLIGVTNIFNTITTSMNLRSKEFAMLKSVGMTKKEFNRMIRLESILYGLKSLVIGCIIGTGLSYLLYKSFARSIDFGFEVPINAIIISAIFIFLVVGITMKYSLNKINKQNIIETIRRDNI